MASKTLDPQGLVCDMCLEHVFGTEEFFALCVAVTSQERRTEQDKDVTIKYTMQVGKMRQDCQWCSYINSAHYVWPDGVPKRKARPNDRVEVELGSTAGGLGTNYAVSSNDSFLELTLDAVRYDPESARFVKDSQFTPPFRRHTSIISAEDNNGAAPYIRFRPLQTLVDIDSTTLQIHQWFEDCNSIDHWMCSKLQSTALPTRVLEVSPVQDPTRPRLVLTAGKKDRYAALSYAWGTRLHDCSLFASTLDKWTDGFEIAALPQTFQDAIKVTRAASIPYLWIDALCIVQDDAEDKRREISAMLNTYGQSTVTIVAGSASSAYDGFLQRRLHPSPPPTVSRAKVPLRLPDGRFGSVHIQQEHLASQHTTLDPINTRAWTMQEQLLAKRYLCYDLESLRYRCVTGSWNIRSSPRFAEDDTLTRYGLQTLQPKSTGQALRH